MNRHVHRHTRIIAIVMPVLLLLLLSCERVDVFDVSEEGGTVSGPAVSFILRGSSLASGGTIDFGIGTPGETASLTLTVTNSGTEVLTFTGRSIQGTDSSYFTSTTPPTTLDLSSSFNLTIYFNPDDTSPRTAYFTITASGTTYTFALKGTAI